MSPPLLHKVDRTLSHDCVMRESVSIPHAATSITSPISDPTKQEQHASLISPQPHHVSFQATANAEQTASPGGHQVTPTESSYDFYADHQAQVRRAQQDKEEQAMKAPRQPKKRQEKNHAWSYILAKFNRPAFFNILWILIAYVACFYNRVHVQVASPTLNKQGVLTSDAYGMPRSFHIGSAQTHIVRRHNQLGVVWRAIHFQVHVWFYYRLL